MLRRWERFAGLVGASGSALWLHRLLGDFPVQNEWDQDSIKEANKTVGSSRTLGTLDIAKKKPQVPPQMWKSFDGIASRHIKKRSKGESGGLHILSGSGYPEIATEVAGLLGITLTKCQLGTFTDGECNIKIADPVSDGDIFIISPTYTDSGLMELLFMISAVRRVGVKRITAVVPYYGYARQDVRNGRETVAASDVATMLETMGVDRVIVVDIHSPVIQGFFGPETPVDHLSTAKLAADYFCRKIDQKMTVWKEKGGTGGPPPKRIVIVASQDGHVTRAADFADCLESCMGEEYSINVALVSRYVEYSGHELYRAVIGDVEGAECIVMDDIVTTGETLKSAVKAISAAGAASISAFATHGRFSEGTKELINSLVDFEELVICDTVPQQEMKNLRADRTNVIHVLNVAPLLAEAIFRTHGRIPMQSLLYSASGGDSDGDIEIATGRNQ